MNNVIAVSQLGVTIADMPILDAISFTVQPGEWIAVVGPNGAGKSTLLKTLLRMQEVTTGSVHIFGKAVQQQSPRDLARMVGYVPQAPPANIPFTVEEFVLAGRFTRQSRWRGVSKDDRMVCQRSMDLMGVQRFRSRLLCQLSGGERQNVFIAAVLAQETEVILFDEPTAFLDPLQKRTVQESIKTLHRETRKTIVTVTHDINAAAHGPTRVIGLKEGQLVFDGNGAGLLDETVLSRVFSTGFSLTIHPQSGKQFAIPEVLC